MKITIVQAEIETAIADYILGQMTINDDQELAIDLSATRGADGMTAEIIVKPKASTDAPARKKPAASTTASKPATVVKTPTPAPASTTTAAAPVAEEAQNEMVADGPNEENTSIAAQAEGKDEGPLDAAPVAGKSIFGSLNKPVNG